MTIPRRTLPRAGTAQRKAAGFTLPELVVAVAVLALLAGLAATTMGGARKGATEAERQTERVQLRTAAAAILGGEIRRAGHLDPERDDSDGAPFGGLPPLEIDLGPPGGDTLLLRYHDDRFRSEAAEITAAYSAGRDGAGRPALYRRAGTGSRQPALEGVSGFEVIALYRAGLREAPTAGGSPGVEAVEIEVTFAWGGRLALVILLGAPLEAVVR